MCSPELRPTARHVGVDEDTGRAVVHPQSSELSPSLGAVAARTAPRAEGVRVLVV